MRYWWVYLLFAFFAGAGLIGVGASACFVVRLLLRDIRHRRFLLYLYQVPLAILYAHFLLGGPREPSPDTLDMLYWSAQVAFLYLALLPIKVEWLDLRPSRQHTRRKWAMWMEIVTAMLLTAALATLVFFGVLGSIVPFVALRERLGQ